MLNLDLVADSIALSLACNVESEATVGVPYVDAVLLSSSSPVLK